MRGALDRLRFQTMRHHFLGVALFGIFLVSCGSDSPKSEEQKPSILPAPKPEAPALKKAELGPQPDLGSVIILEVPGEGAQSFYLRGEPGARYLAKVTPLYGSSKTKKKKKVVAAAEQAQTGESKAAASPEPPKPPQGFAATFFAVAESPSLPGSFYTAETLKGLQEGRYQLPSPPAPPPEAAQATETAPMDPSADQNLPQKDLQNTSRTPLPTLPDRLWTPVTNKGIEVFDVETEVLPGNTSNQENQATQPVVLEIKNLDAVPRTVKIVIREKKS